MPDATPRPGAERERRSPTPSQLRSQGAAWGLVVLGVVVWAVGRWAGPEAAPPDGWRCPRPRSLRVERGFTRVVTCETMPGGGHPLRGPARWLFGGRVALDRADRRLLEALPGIGEARARAIVSARGHAPFESLDDLDRVHGIGPATLEGLRPFARITPPQRGEIAADAPVPSDVGASAKPDGEG